jgi:hypothetical protein
MKYLAIFCIVLQVLDGILTALGVNMLGLNAEGNPLVKECMRLFGVVPALTAFKILGIFAVVQIYNAVTSPVVLSFVCGIYSVTSVAWIFILFGLVS